MLAEKLDSMPVDPLKRFTPTPVTTTVRVAGVAVRVETNCVAVIFQLLEALALAPAADPGLPSFSWKIVVEPQEEPELEGECFDPHSFSYGDLSLIHISRQSFVACDRGAREGIAFLSPNLANQAAQFRRYFVPALLLLMEYRAFD
jgi:hypothetical protein